MNGIRGLLFRVWMWRTSRRSELGFIKRLEQEQDTVRLKWDDIMGSERGGRHRLRKG